MPRIDQAVRIAWIDAIVLVGMEDGTIRKVPGETMGLLSIHKSDEGWAVTHVPTKWNITSRIASAADAKAIAEAACERAKPTLVMQTIDTVRKAAPEWFAKWMRACRGAGRLVEVPQ